MINHKECTIQEKSGRNGVFLDTDRQTRSLCSQITDGIAAQKLEESCF